MIFALLLFLSVLADKVPFDAPLNFKMNKISTLLASPDGKKFAYLVTRYLKDTDTRVVVLCVQSVNDNPDNITNPVEVHDVSSFAWDPTSKYIVYITSTDPTSLNTLDVSTGECISHQSYNVPLSFPKWSPTGKVLVFAASVYPGMTPKETADYDEGRSNYHSSAMVFEHTPVFRYTEFENGKYRHLFYVHVDPDSKNHFTFSDTPVDIMKNYAGHCPNKWDGSLAQFSFSPNGKFLVYGTQPQAASGMTSRLHLYLHTIVEDPDKTDDGKSICLTLGQVGNNMAPVFSPDNHYLAWIYDVSDQQYGSKKQIYILDLFTREKRILAESFDMQPNAIQWSKFLPEYIIVLNAVRGKVRIFPIEVSTGKVYTEHPVYTVRQATVISHDRILFLRSTYSSPIDVYSARIFAAPRNPNSTEESATNDPFERIQHTHVNKEILDSLSQPLYAPAELSLKAANGDPMQAYYFPPRSLAVPPFDPDEPENNTSNTTHKYSAGKTPEPKSVPLMMWVHGGPEGCSYDEWLDRFQPLLFALGNSEMEMAILIPNIHGSLGFGQRYTDLIRKKWHITGLNDVLAARKQTVQLFDYLDENRTACMGTSFGGYMNNLLQCQATAEKNPFVCLVSSSGIYDTTKLFLEVDLPYFMHSESGEYPWTDRTWMDKMSPSRQPGVGKFHTPMLLFHGLLDYRVRFGQAKSMFSALQRVYDVHTNPCASRLIVFPDEAHDFARPANLEVWYKEINSWLNTYLSPAAAQKTMDAKMRLDQMYRQSRIYAQNSAQAETSAQSRRGNSEEEYNNEDEYKSEL